MSLSTKKRIALVVLLSGASNHEAAAAAGVRHETVCRWKQLADFAHELTAGQAQIQRKTQSDLAELHEKALARIGDALDDEEVGVRLRAASLVVSRSASPGPCAAVTVSNNVSVGGDAQNDRLTVEEALEHAEDGPAPLVEAVALGYIAPARAQAHLVALAEATAQALTEIDDLQSVSKADTAETSDTHRGTMGNPAEP